MQLLRISRLAVMVATLSLVAAPAEAASLSKGSTIQLKNNIQGGVLKIDSTDTGEIKFDFFGARKAGRQPIANNQGVTVASASGDFLSTNSGPIARIKDLNLTPTLNANILKLGSFGFLSGLDTVSANNLKFNLESFVYYKDTGIGKFKGTFEGGQVGLGTFNLGNAITNPAGSPIVLNDYNYALSVTAVPTPALLPGLIGFGVAAWRKRKGKASGVGEEVA